MTNRQKQSGIRNLRVALDEMRFNGATLMKMHTTRGLAWFLVPRGPVSPDLAMKILEDPRVQPSLDGLFPGISQTFKWKS